VLEAGQGLPDGLYDESGREWLVNDGHIPLGNGDVLVDQVIDVLFQLGAVRLQFDLFNF
jgi:hypothetical protein